jgi:hypothetical protein
VRSTPRGTMLKPSVPSLLPSSLHVFLGPAPGLAEAPPVLVLCKPPLGDLPGTNAAVARVCVHGSVMGVVGVTAGHDVESGMSCTILEAIQAS